MTNQPREIKAMICASPLYCRKRNSAGNCTKHKLFGKNDERPECYNCVMVKITIFGDENQNTHVSFSILQDKTNETLRQKIQAIMKSLLIGYGVQQ